MFRVLGPSWDKNTSAAEAILSSFNPQKCLSYEHILDAAKRRLLPAWIREGLEKMERDKQKKLEKEKQKKELEEKKKAKRAAEEEAEEELRREKEARGEILPPRKSRFV